MFFHLNCRGDGGCRNVGRAAVDDILSISALSLAAVGAVTSGAHNAHVFRYRAGNNGWYVVERMLQAS